MSWSYTFEPHVWPALITAILTAILGWYGWQRRSFPPAKPFAFLCLFAFLWAVGCILEISATDFSTKIFWIKFQGIWQQPEATTWPWFVLAYAGLGRWLTRRNLWIMFTPAFLSIAVILTNDYHHLLWKDFLVGENIIQVFGVANWILIGYAFIPVLVTVIILLWLAIRSRIHRWPAIIMLLGMVIAFGIYWLVNINADFLDAGERILFTMGVLALSFSVALFQFHALDPVRLARSTVIEQMGEGMLVLDLQGKIVDLNSAAARILGNSQAGLSGRDVTKVLPTNLELLMPIDKSNRSPIEICLGNAEALRYYNLNITTLADKHNQVLGTLVLLQETTEQKHAQAQILEQQQVVATLKERERLARELHDGIGQVLGYVNMQAQTIQKWVQAGNTEKAESLLNRLAEVAKGAHTDVRESILSLKAGSGQEWAFLPTLKQYLSDFQAYYNIQTRLFIPNCLTESVFEAKAEVQLLRVVQEALTNARKHSGARTVRVTISQEDSRGYIVVADDGSGFDPSNSNQESGRHFGLAFMKERMAEIGGNVNIDSQPGAGTVIKLEAPIRTAQEKTR